MNTIKSNILPTLLHYPNPKKLNVVYCLRNCICLVGWMWLSTMVSHFHNCFDCNFAYILFLLNKFSNSLQALSASMPSASSHAQKSRFRAQLSELYRSKKNRRWVKCTQPNSMVSVCKVVFCFVLCLICMVVPVLILNFVNCTGAVWPSGDLPHIMTTVCYNCIMCLPLIIKWCILVILYSPKKALVLLYILCTVWSYYFV